MIPTLNYDAITSDPLLMVAGVFLIAGPLVFIIALFKFVAWGRKQKNDDFEFSELHPFSGSFNQSEAPLEPSSGPVSSAELENKLEPEPQPVIEISGEAYHKQEPVESSTDKTMITPPGTGEIQGQMEIAFSQIKTLNKKVAQMESELDSVARNISGRLERNELKEIPMNPADFTQKLLKLAEHVIVLEKEVERLKSSRKTEGESTPPAASEPTEQPQPDRFPKAPRPPVMPL